MLDLFRGLLFRIVGRCIVCDRLMALHTPWALYICERLPLPIEITEHGETIAETIARVSGHAASVSHARSA